MLDLYPWQQSLWQQFLAAKNQQKLAHAIALTGVDGLGKAQFAQQMAKAVLCLSPNEEGNACGQCHSCQVFDAGNHPDHLDIEPEEAGKQIKIEQIRDLKEKQQLTPTISTWKTVVINPAYSMNVNANNSLLKLLEEPEANTLIILITSKPERMPITVKSRCQSMHFNAPEKETCLKWLQQHYPNFNDAPLVDELLQLAKGAPLKLIEMLEENVGEQVTQINTDFEQLIKLSQNPMQLAAAWMQYEPSQLMEQLYQNVHKRIVELNKMPKTQQSDAQGKQYWQIADCIVHTTKLISSQNNLNKQLLLEGFLVELSTIFHTKA